MQAGIIGKILFCKQGGSPFPSSSLGTHCTQRICIVWFRKMSCTMSRIKMAGLFNNESFPPSKVIKSASKGWKGSGRGCFIIRRDKKSFLKIAAAEASSKQAGFDDNLGWVGEAGSEAG